MAMIKDAIGVAFKDAHTTAGSREVLLAPVHDRENYVQNPTFDRGNSPIGHTFNGITKGDTYRNNAGLNEYLPFWRAYCPNIIDENQYFVFTGPLFMEPFPPFDLVRFYAGEQDRVIILHGAGDLFKDEAVNNFNNDNADRGDGTTGKHVDFFKMRIVSNTTLSTISSSQSMDDAAIWVRNEWYQEVAVPDSATTCTFGAKIRVNPTDPLRELNFSGMYCWTDSADRNSRVVNYFGVRHDDATFTLPTGSLTGDPAEYNWNGMEYVPSTGNAATPAHYVTPTASTVTQKAMLDQGDLSDWTDVEYSFTLESGTSRYVAMALYFAENSTYMQGDDDTNSGTVKFYAPFMTFS